MRKELNRKRLVFKLPGEMGELAVSPAALDHLLRHRQHHRWNAEAGGQLFATVAHGVVSIETATGPHIGDRRARFSFVPNRHSERQEIAAMHARGLHYVGDWHTHPEANPMPSDIDCGSMSETVAKSGHELAGLLLIVVGTGDAPGCISAWLLTDHECARLALVRDTDQSLGESGMGQ